VVMGQTSVRCVVVYPSDQVVEEQMGMSGCVTSGSDFGALCSYVSV
jgi:hypothetical protein